MTTPAAWVEAWRGMPSSARAVSMRFLTVGFSSYIFLSSGLTASARSIVICSSIGTCFATASTSL